MPSSACKKKNHHEAHCRPFLRLPFFFLMIRRPPRSTQSRSSAASDVYKRQSPYPPRFLVGKKLKQPMSPMLPDWCPLQVDPKAVSYTHLRAHETRHDLVC